MHLTARLLSILALAVATPAPAAPPSAVPTSTAPEAAVVAASGAVAASSAVAADSATADSATGAARTVPATPRLSAAAAADVALRQAAYAWSTGDLQGAVLQLESIDLRAPGFPQRDRAAFLLGDAYLRLGERERFLALARAMAEAERGADGASHPDDSPYMRWLQYRRLAFEAGGAITDAASLAGADTRTAPSLPGSAVLLAAVLLRAGRVDAALSIVQGTQAKTASPALCLYVQALGQGLAEGRAAPPRTTAQNGDSPPRDPSPALLSTLQALARADAHTAIDRELIDAAHLELATIALRRGADPVGELQAVAHDGPHAGDAQLMLGLHGVAQADTAMRARGRTLLEQVAATDSSAARRREAGRALIALALDSEDWTGARRAAQQLDARWSAERAELQAWLDPTAAADLWQRWQGGSMARAALLFDPATVDRAASALVAASLDLSQERPPAEPAPPDAAALWASTGAHPQDLPLPTRTEWESVQQQAARAQQAHADQSRAEAAVVAEQEQLARQRAYLERGLDLLGQSHGQLAQASARLDSLLAFLDSVLAQLTSVRDEHLRRTEQRTRELVRAQQLQLAHDLFLQHFYVDGPNRTRPERFPEGVPNPEQLLQADAELSTLSAAFIDSFARRVPLLVQRSYRDVWEPRLTAGTRDLSAQARRELAWVQRLEVEVGESRRLAMDSPALRDRQAALRRAQATAQAQIQAEATLRTSVARAAVQRALDALAAEREGIDYDLACTAHELAVGRGRDAEDPAVRAELATSRQAAITQLDTFLTRYPRSPARGEVRFRLADLRLLAAKDDFNAKMSRFLAAAQATGSMDSRAMAPFVDYDPALRLYRQIRAEDPTFPHQDAVLFNIGMIESDAGIATAQETLHQLVTEHPQSPFCQQAWLRMGDNCFDVKDYAGCVPFYTHAADGSDNELTAIALYKLGWAHFDEDRFLYAADAFRRLLDLYASGAQVRTSTDLRAEAEDYLVHALCRAGGAVAFSEYFDRVGKRAYESRILWAMGALLRKFSLYGDAATTDELWLARYGQDAQALAVAQRLIDTYERANKPEQARAARLHTAPLFLPGSSWFAANAADTLRASGERFAQTSYKTLALYHHHLARKEGGAAHWTEALDLYQTLLAHWPTDGEAARFHFYSGEAAAQLKQYCTALAHYSLAAASDTVSFRADALWQRVAVADAWYESTRPGPPVARAAGAAADGGATAAPARGKPAVAAGMASASLGSDSLATVVTTAATAFVAAYPNDARAADILWRSGVLSYAHGRNQDAASSFEQLMRQHGSDARAPVAARLRGDAIYRTQAFDRAGDAYEEALALAKTAHADTLVARLTLVVPQCRTQHAEAVARADSTHPGRAAELFAAVETRWPAYAHADLALYRAGLLYAKAKSAEPAVRCFDGLIARHPRSEYVKDAHLQIASAWGAAGRPREAAAAYERFAQAYPKDDSAPDAMLKAAELLANAGDEAAAEQSRTRYMGLFPEDFETAMAILERRARTELAHVDASTSLSSLLAPPAKGSKVPPTSLSRYLELAQAHPKLASRPIAAQVAFLKAEERRSKYEALRLTQPIAASIEAKKHSLELLLGAYKDCAQLAVSPWTDACAFRIGEALVHFGDALRGSTPPAQLQGDDLAAYRQVLEEQAWQFDDRGEEAWSKLLESAARLATGDAVGGAPAKQGGGAQDKPEQGADEGGWIARTKQALWPRVAQRFAHHPEVEYPLETAAPSRVAGETSQ